MCELTQDMPEWFSRFYHARRYSKGGNTTSTPTTLHRYCHHFMSTTCRGIIECGEGAHPGD